MNQISIFLDPNGKAGVKTPYNAAFVDELKKNIPSANWDSHQGIWFFDPISRDQAEKLVKKYYPDDLELVRITWSFQGSKPAIDGVELVSIYKSSWQWKRNCSISFKVIEVDLKVNRAFCLTGTCTIEAHLRKDASIYPSPDKLSILAEAERYNPLTGFTDEELAQELINRGYEICARS